MGSRIMHYIISRQLAKTLPIENKETFMIGGVSPDAARDKEISHYYRGEVYDYTRHIDFSSFIEACQEEDNESYVLGYYTHLISDDLWLKGFYMPWLRNRIIADRALAEKYHRDFHLLNAKLAEHYSLSAGEIPFNIKEQDLPSLPEVSPHAARAFLSYIQEDLQYNESQSQKPLQVFTFDQIIGYIETSIDQSRLLLQRHYEAKK
ncbi:zinc dependent phospholipase C family protein [Bacillus testis]|uniref:zinc dependent phospholipase C family protein n=1 Tax=Bacillus testis TaxID=1622072 RepID=UPI00067EB230|nr:zinc dependent phospholipase C family protein [Bacillus testis]